MPPDEGTGQAMPAAAGSSFNETQETEKNGLKRTVHNTKTAVAAEMERGSGIKEGTQHRKQQRGNKERDTTDRQFSSCSPLIYRKINKHRQDTPPPPPSAALPRTHCMAPSTQTN